MELEILLGVAGMAGWVTAGVFALQWRGTQMRVKELISERDGWVQDVGRLTREKEGMRAALAVMSTPGDNFVKELKGIKSSGRELLRERLAKHMAARVIQPDA